MGFWKRTMAYFTRRQAISTVGALIIGSTGVAAAEDQEKGGESADDQENYAIVDFREQESDGHYVTIRRAKLLADGFITIHTWDLIDEQDGPNTICGVSHLLTPGDYYGIKVPLFNPGSGYSEAFGEQNRLQETQRLVAVPHRDMNHNGTFDFTGESHIDIPFTRGPAVRTDLPVTNAVNDIDLVKVVENSG